MSGKRQISKTLDRHHGKRRAGQGSTTRKKYDSAMRFLRLRNGGSEGAYLCANERRSDGGYTLASRGVALSKWEHLSGDARSQADG
ncbi:hypothetical protein PAAG_12573 [Paracoccidioides lutzii Pb01]|uniref:Uncharacterized protein n=1 Tax=Paracoccidioides lutzii (strain ATCC MYA-826 / Pb01) TaxID=502779 RepID=A0A0A2V3P7_PARBA|nr:hypothetical protein PAAG_12573 [Paracoccidioides lutzii Pb01]KGQ00760.1 hypothetical protein PAAG_12573 [Paracoccidioides lutzii Pb01]